MSNIETHIVIKSSSRRDKVILDKLKQIDSDASYAGGVGSSGHRVFIVDGTPEQYTKLLKEYIESGVVRSIDEF